MIRILTCLQKSFKLFLILTFAISCTQTQTDYQTVFGINYTNAQKYLLENKWIIDSLQKYEVPPSIAIPIIFPELVRYSSIQNEIETRSLEVLYAQYGLKYADFSIGHFQIKPSFACRTEKDWNLFNEKNKLKASIAPFDTVNEPKVRIERIYRLKDQKWQIKYLIMFYMLMEQKVAPVILNDVDKIKLYSTAYNAGYWHDLKTLNRLSNMKFYHIGLIMPKRCYSYSDIAIDYFKKQMPK